MKYLISIELSLSNQGWMEYKSKSWFRLKKNQKIFFIYCPNISIITA